ncbi:hypothetical protein [Microbacterium excoecariae]|uniref:hypothetical protein n=1 Tax=Microbacterium excoecariae TaxID=2715210 RepID=UPI001408BD8D|nr:hypothetical protein [Microbacterium excoecariae]NHI17487.1 hypothetical protein [Microbacterium excoecariae]
MKVRLALSLLGGALVAYFSVRGIVGALTHGNAGGAFVAVAMFVAAALVALLAPGSARRTPHGPGTMALWAALITCAVAALLPLVATRGIPPSDAPQVTWFLGAGGVLMTIVCARRRAALAWAGMIAHVCAATTVMSDLPGVLTAGGMGSLLWVGIAQLLVVFTDRAYRDTARLALIQQQSSAWEAVQDGRSRERRERVQVAIGLAGPVLARVIDQRGLLGADEKADALFVEATLRDELRGRGLLDTRVRSQLARLRRSGVVVSLYDDGGLEALDAAEIQAVRGELEAVLAGVEAARLIVRTSRSSDVVVTVVGRGSDGEDDVTAWHEIARPR